MKEIAYSKQSIRTLRRIPANEAARIQSKIRQYAEDPKSQAANVKKLQGRDGYRLRIGDWRVIFDEDHMVLAIINIGARGSIYE
jgi:mRNA interferase RelE/StbE